MADLYLVRHGQASFGQAVYDKLSPLGERQAMLLGRWLKQCGIVPDAIATGTPSRQIETAGLCAAAFGGPSRERWLRVEGLNEYDHEEVVARFRPDYADPAAMRADLAKSANPRRAFQAMYKQAVARWVAGEHDHEYKESWVAFRVRVMEGLRCLTAIEARCICAFTSGGPIAVIAQHCLGVPHSSAFELNWPLVNSGITRLRFSTRAGAVSLATFNAHPHLDQAGDPDLITYR